MKRSIKNIMLAAAICCITSAQAQTIVKVKKTGTLGQMAGELRLDTCSYLTIEGKLNSADIRVLRQLAGYEEKGGSSGNLLMLDLRKAKFASDDEPFMELDASKEKLAGVIQPYKANEYSTWIPSLNYLSSRLGKPIRSRSSLGDGGIFGRVYGSRRVIAYKPIYYLNHTLDVPLQVITTIKLQNDRESSAESESVFYAKNGIGDSLWKAIRKKGLERCKGHVLERREDGSCWLKVSSRKGQFSPVTFYKCPRLRVVALPRKIKFAPDVYDEGNQILYFIGSNLYLWDRKEIAHDVQEQLRKQSGWSE